MNDKQRAEFEKFVESYGWPTDVDEDGYYEETVVQMSWNCWQAAIASVVVELPLWEHKNGYQVYPVSDVKDSINKAGIRYE